MITNNELALHAPIQKGFEHEQQIARTTDIEL